MIVRFDRGNGQPAQKELNDPIVGKWRLRVAINPHDNLWDLFPAENFVAAAAPTVSAPAVSPGAVPTTSVPPTGGTVKFAAPPPGVAGKAPFHLKTPRARKMPSWPTVKTTKAVQKDTPPAPAPEPEAP